MRFAINLPNFGVFGDARLLAELAVEAEAMGWDGFFLWDHTRPGPLPVVEPWVALTAIAIATQRIRLGPMVTPLPRRRLEELSRQSVSLDHLSSGRLILGVGLGDDLYGELSGFGHELDAVKRGRMLDEGLEVLTGLWSGKSFSFDGEWYHVKAAEFQPRPVQQPAIPIWVGGRWPARPPFRRGARFQGIVPGRRSGPMTPALCKEIVDFTQAQRPANGPFDVAVTVWRRDLSAEDEAEQVAAFEAAGANWYQISFAATTKIAGVREAIRRGPPRGRYPQ